MKIYELREKTEFCEIKLMSIYDNEPVNPYLKSEYDVFEVEKIEIKNSVMLVYIDDITEFVERVEKRSGKKFIFKEGSK